ncbi:putative nucleoside diphosphate kinase regulator [Bradyrhizobium diazoefficiens SEMIA 5080]|jgi:regulator of nucleoside diphosphate kinase|nr:putative nucleoside diphosphate kinase regulator [Bradyrhizobium diazoefficiens SEMIA 5080]
MTMIRDHQPPKEGREVMSKTTYKDKPEIVLPPVTVLEDEARRLSALASSSAVLFPRVAHFLAREIERASVVANNSELRGVVRMGSQVRYCDEKTGEVRDVVLVYPHEADITLKRVSVLTPVGAALIGLSVGQAIEFQTPGHNKRSLTVLGVSN